MATKAGASAARPASGKPAGSATGRNYEIHRCVGGRWTLDSVSDEKDVAMAMAKSLLESNRAPSEVKVVVVQQKHDGQFTEVAIYRATIEEHRATEMEARKQKRLSEAANGRLGYAPQAPRMREARNVTTLLLTMKATFFGTTTRTWIAIGLTVAWCAVFYLWHQPQAPWAFDSPAARTTVKTRVPLP
jgi:hypothetical protein